MYLANVQHPKVFYWRIQRNIKIRMCHFMLFVLDNSQCSHTLQPIHTYHGSYFTSTMPLAYSTMFNRRQCLMHFASTCTITHIHCRKSRKMELNDWKVARATRMDACSFFACHRCINAESPVPYTFTKWLGRGKVRTRWKRNSNDTHRLYSHVTAGQRMTFN